ncbi:MAG: hypothetical protein IIX01_00970 [Clostridia bacterium]|nr:hypothetical protein [Clostridia bacterium]
MCGNHNYSCRNVSFCDFLRDLFTPTDFCCSQRRCYNSCGNATTYPARQNGGNNRQCCGCQNGCWQTCNQQRCGCCQNCGCQNGCQNGCQRRSRSCCGEFVNNVLTGSDTTTQNTDATVLTGSCGCYSGLYAANNCVRNYTCTNS